MSYLVQTNSLPEAVGNALNNTRIGSTIVYNTTNMATNQNFIYKVGSLSGSSLSSTLTFDLNSALIFDTYLNQNTKKKFGGGITLVARGS